MAQQPQPTIITVTQPAFTGGEVSPEIYARRLLEKYAISCRKLLNWFVSPQGGVSTRGGTEYIQPHKNEAKKARLLPYQYSATVAFQLELGELATPWATATKGNYTGYIRFYAQGLPLLAAGIGSPAGPYTSGDLYLHTDNITYVCTDDTAVIPGGANWQDYWYPLETYGGTPGDAWYEIPTFYDEEDVLALNKEQDEELMTLTRKGHKIKLLESTNSLKWDFRDNVFGSTLTPPTGVAPPTGTTYTFALSAFDSLTGEESIITAPFTAGLTQAFTWTDPADGDYIKIYKETNGVYDFLGKVAFGVQTYTIQAATPFEVDKSHNAIESIVDPYPGADGPNVCAFYEQRMVYGNDPGRAQTFIGSVTGEPRNMNRHYPLIDGDSYYYKISAKEINELYWFMAMDRLIAGTPGGIWSIAANANANSINPNQPPSIILQTSLGASTVPPVVVGKNLLYLELNGDRVRDLGFDYTVQGYDGDDLTILARHMFEELSIISWCYQRSPDSIIWCVRSDGVLLGLTYYKEHKIWAWHEHQTDGEVEQVSCVRSTSGTDDVYLSVKRTVNSVTRRYIEIMKPRLPGIVKEKAWAVDCAVSYNYDTPGVAINVLTGYGHLVGKTVSVLGDGNVYKNLVVDGSGQVTLPDSETVTRAIGGLPYVCDLETLDLDAQDGTTALIDKKKRGVEASVRLKDSAQLKLGSSFDTLESVSFRYGESLDAPTQLFSGVKTKSIKPKLTAVDDTDRGTRICIRVDDPVPVTVQSITAEIEFGPQY